MKATLRLLGYQLSDVARSRWLIGYALFFLAVTDVLLRFGGGSGKALLSLMNVVLLVVPLVSAVFGTTYVYDTREFTELLLAQPVSRRKLYAALYGGLALPLSLALVAGVGLPFAVHGFATAEHRVALAVLLGCGAALTWAFVAVAFLIAIRSQDKVRGLGLAVIAWLVTALVWDGLILLVAATFADWPLERPMLALLMANPVDLARVLLLLQFDVSALMGYTGAVFSQFFGGPLGIAVATGVLLLWIAIPAGLGLRAFRTRDF